MNQRINASQERTTGSNLTDVGRVAVRTFAIVAEGTLCSINVVEQEAAVKDCGVTAAKLQGQSWAPHLTNGEK